MKFIRKSKDLTTKRQLKQAYLDLKTAFELLAKKPSEKAIFRYFNFMAWIDSKINESEFDEEVRQQFLGENEK